MEGEAARLFIPQSPTVDIHTRALERNAQKFLDSPQALIRSFLNNAIPEFPDLSIVDDALGSSIFTNDYVVKDMLNNLEGHAHNDSEDLSSNNSSLVLSLPESFELAPVTTIASKRPLMAKMSADLLELEYKQLVQTILSALPKEHCPRCREIVLEVESQLVHVLQAHSTALQSERTKSEIVQKSHQVLLVETKALEARCDRLSTLLDQETKARSLTEDLATKSSSLSSENTMLKKQLSDLETLHAEQSRFLKDTQSRLEELKSSANDAVRGKDLLSLDAQHLRQEVDTLQGRLSVQAETLSLERQKAIALEEKVQQLTSQLLQVTTQTNRTAEERVEKEVARVRDEVQREVDGLRHTSREISDREARALQELKTSLELENADLRRRNDSLSSQLQVTQSELALSVQAKAQEGSELRAELKIKAFELSSLSLTFEQRMQQLRQVELELEAARDQVVAHKSALLRLEGEKDAMIASLRASVKALEQKVEAYETLESEVDAAVVRTAQGMLQSTASMGQEAVLQGAFIDREVGGGTVVVPVSPTYTHPSRRLQQAVQLAQRALRAEGKVQELEGVVREREAALAKAEEEVNSLRLSVQRAAQPTAYLVSKLRDEEMRRAKAEGDLKEARQLVRLAEEREGQYRQEVTLLRERLATLLRHRGELQTVRAMLQHLHDQETSDEEEEPHDEEEEEGEEEQRGRRGGEEEVKAMSAWASAGSRLSLDDTSLLSEMPGRTDSATSPVRKPMGSLASRAMRLGVSPDLLAQMLARPQGQPAAMSEVILPGIALKGYRRIEGPTSHA